MQCLVFLKDLLGGGENIVEMVDLDEENFAVSKYVCMYACLYVYEEVSE